MIKKLNMCGIELEDVQIVAKMTQLEVLSLAVNHLSSLSAFPKCFKLRELYLRNNRIRDLNQVAQLKPLKSLRVLSLRENPCQTMFTDESYRGFILNQLPQLTKIDDKEVTPEERARCKMHSHPVPLKREEAGGWLSSNEEAPLDMSTQHTQAAFSSASPKAQLRHLNTSKDIKPTSRSRYHPDSFLSRGKVKTVWLDDDFQSPQQSRPIGSNQLTPPHGASALSLQHGNQGYQSARLFQAVPKKQQDNILCAIMALSRDLDRESLEIVRKDIEKKISDIDVGFNY